MVPMMPKEIMMSFIFSGSIKNIHDMAIINHIVPMACIFVLFVMPLLALNSRIYGPIYLLDINFL